MTEAQWQRQVIELAQLSGWRVAHFRAARTANGGWRTPVQADGAGFPDLVLVRGSRLIFAELKGPKGRVSQAQTAWLDSLLGVMTNSPNVSVRLWRPDDFDAVLEELRRA